MYWSLKPKRLGNVPQNPSTHSCPGLQRERQRGGGPCQGRGPRGCCARSLRSGPQGPGVGLGSRPALCLRPPPPQPRSRPQRRGQLAPAPGQVARARRVPEATRACLGSGQWTCVHTCSGTGRGGWAGPGRDSHTQTGKAPGAGIGGTPGRVRPPRGPSRGAENPAEPLTPPSMGRERTQERAMAEQRLRNCSARKIKGDPWLHSQHFKPQRPRSALMRSRRTRRGEGRGGSVQPGCVPCGPGPSCSTWTPDGGFPTQLPGYVGPALMMQTGMHARV